MGAGGAALLERTDELDRVDALLDAAVDGGGAVAIVEGLAGVGKTTLLDAAIGRGRAMGLRTLHSRAGQLEREIGWNVVRQLFEAVIRADRSTRRRLLQDAAGLAAPALGLSEGSDAGALHGLYWLTEGLSEHTPLLVAVDDAHWADDASLGYLAYLAERVEELPVVLLLTVRAGEEIPDPLAVLMSRPHADRLALRELTSAASARLTRAALGESASETFCAACYEATGGNPFLLGELLAQLSTDGIEPTAARAEEVARITPGTVRRSVLLRLSRFGPDAQRLAGAVAALGESSLGESAAVAGIDPASAARLADALSAAGILNPGAPLEFVHAIVREAVYGELAPHERGRLHRRAAGLLARNGSQGRAAAQLLEAEPDSDPWVVHQLCAAAESAMAEGAPAVAATLLHRAVREPPSGPELPPVLVALGRAEAASGSPAAAQRMIEAVQGVREPRQRAEIQLERGRLLYLAGRPGEAAEAFDDGLRDLGSAGQGHASLEAELTAGWLTAARLEVPLRRRAEEMTHAIAADPPGGGSYGERALLAHIAGQLTFEGEPRERGIALAYDALGNGELIRQETSDGLSWVAAMGALGWGDDFDGFDALQQEAIEDARRRGSVLGYATAMYGSNFTHYYGGMIGDAIDDARRAIDAERDGWRHFLTAARAQLAWGLIEHGELEAAEAQLDQAEVDPALEANSAQSLVGEARARIHLIRGDPAAALESALAGGQVFLDARITNPSILPWRSRAAIAAGALGDRDRAEELLSEELELARRYGAPRPIGVALTAAGIVRGGDGVPALEEAVAILEPSPARLEHARALVMLGAALRRKGRLIAARDVLERGLADASTFGAWVLEERARLELAATGVRPQRQRRSGTEALTAAERRVAEAATDGLSNREIAQALFVSLRTVETHLTHVYQKLGIQGRAELAPALGQLAA